MDFHYRVPYGRGEHPRSRPFQNRHRRGSKDGGNIEMNIYTDGSVSMPRTNLRLDSIKRMSGSVQSLTSELGEFVKEDSFQTEVAQKTQLYMIGRQEAETEVCIDRIINAEGSKDKALLYVISKIHKEAKSQVFVSTLLNRGANPSTCDEDLWTPLHYAVKNNFREVCSKLLESDALPNVRDKYQKMPLFIAIENDSDDIAALLITYMYNAEVRQLFLSEGDKDVELHFSDLLSRKLQKTTLAVLDCMIDTYYQTRQVRVYYNILEADDHGRPPDDPLFNQRSKTPLQLIAKTGNKDMVYHDSVRLLMKRKWINYARLRFQVNCAIYLFSLFVLTYCVVVAAMTPDPMVYNNALHIVRAVFEVFFYLMALVTLCVEINQFRKHRIEYFQDKFNLFDAGSTVLILTVLPLRVVHRWEQWPVYSMGYLLWTLRIFKYAAVFRQTGAYIQILWQILTSDFIQFMALFLVILLAFSGSFLLALRGEESLHVHEETSTFWGILFVGIRTLIESDPVLTYTGPDGYKTFSCLLMVMFLFMCCVVLLNILIAQLSDTYQNIQQDAQRGLEVNRAWIITRVELNSVFIRKSQREAHYTPYEDIHDVDHVLQKWKSPPISPMNEYVQDIWDSLKAHKLDQLTIQNRLARQETALMNIQEQLENILSQLGSTPPPTSAASAPQDISTSHNQIDTHN